MILVRLPVATIMMIIREYGLKSGGHKPLPSSFVLTILQTML